MLIPSSLFKSTVHHALLRSHCLFSFLLSLVHFQPRWPHVCSRQWKCDSHLFFYLFRECAKSERPQWKGEPGMICVLQHTQQVSVILNYTASFYCCRFVALSGAWTTAGWFHVGWMGQCMSGTQRLASVSQRASSSPAATQVSPSLQTARPSWL